MPLTLPTKENRMELIMFYVETIKRIVQYKYHIVNQSRKAEGGKTLIIFYLRAGSLS